MYHQSRAARSSGQKHLVMLHCVYFDGTSFFVDGPDFYCDEYTNMVKSFTDFDVASEFADHENDNL